MAQGLREGVDFYFNAEGLMVLTRAYHLKRGYCCQSGCTHCPWDYRSKADPDVPAEWGPAEDAQDGIDDWEDDN